MRFSILALVVGAALLATEAGAQSAAAPSTPVAIARRWLALIDKGLGAEGWDQASGSFRSHVGRAAFSNALASVRKPLGKVRSRRLAEETPLHVQPTREGDMYGLEFDTAFARGRETESVDLVHEPSGWKVDGYWISKVDPLLLPYKRPDILAAIPSGPTIHIKCMGAGSPTVILSGGLGDWVGGWRMVQPEIAKTTRVCAWDRPGFGFSSGSTQRQTVLATTADLEAALKIAHVDGPYIAVGQSLGGYESLLFKDRNPEAVVGMVLVDPSIPDQWSRLRKAAPDFMNFSDSSRTQQIARDERCITDIRSGKVKPGSFDPDGCLYYPAFYPRVLRRAFARRSTDPLWLTTAESLNAAFDEDARLVVNPRRNYGDMPLIVLTATKMLDVPEMPQLAKAELPAQHAEWVRGHDELAALSSRGVNRPVADSGHMIQDEQPKAVIDAIEEVISAARAKR